MRGTRKIGHTFLSVGVQDGVIVYYHLIFHHRIIVYKISVLRADSASVIR
jgi:hypothetical protein